MVMPLPICHGCKHVDRNSLRGPLRCAAFPEGIPQEIVENKFLHRNAYPGDSGLLYEVMPQRRLMRYECEEMLAEEAAG